MSLESDLRAALLAAGLPVTNVYAPDGSDRSAWQVGFSDAVTDDQRAVANRMLATWSPPVEPPAVSGDAIIGAISKADRAKADPTDLARIAWRDDVPEGNAKLARIAKALGTTPDALRASAGAIG